MKHGHHAVLGVTAVLVAIMIFTAGGANPLVAGVGVALLLCPIVMGVVMWLLMRQPAGPRSTGEHHERRVTAKTEQP